MRIDAPAIECARAAVYQRWSRYVSHPEALAQADAFARRCRSIGRENHLTATEFDRMVTGVAEIMAEP